MTWPQGLIPPINQQKTLKELFPGELADIYDAEHQLVKALPKMQES